MFIDPLLLRHIQNWLCSPKKIEKPCHHSAWPRCWAITFLKWILCVVPISESRWFTQNSAVSCFQKPGLSSISLPQSFSPGLLPCSAVWRTLSVASLCEVCFNTFLKGGWPLRFTLQAALNLLLHAPLPSTHFLMLKLCTWSDCTPREVALAYLPEPTALAYLSFAPPYTSVLGEGAQSNRDHDVTTWLDLL